MQQSLKNKGLLPARHLVDTGYIEIELAVATKQDFGVELVS